MSCKTILVGVNGSPTSRRALAWASAHAHEHGGEVVAAHVMTLGTELMLDLPPTGFTTWRRRVRQELEHDWVEVVRAAGVSYRTLLVEDASVESGLRLAADRNAVDLIALGAGEHGALAHRLFGNVGDKVVQAVHRPVVIVPKAWA